MASTSHGVLPESDTAQPKHDLYVIGIPRTDKETIETCFALLFKDEASAIAGYTVGEYHVVAHFSDGMQWDQFKKPAPVLFETMHRIETTWDTVPRQPAYAVFCVDEDGDGYTHYTLDGLFKDVASAYQHASLTVQRNYQAKLDSHLQRVAQSGLQTEDAYVRAHGRRAPVQYTDEARIFVGPRESESGDNHYIVERIPLQ